MTDTGPNHQPGARAGAMRDPQAESNVSVVVVCARVVLPCQEMRRGYSCNDCADCSTMHVYTPRGCNKPE